MALVNDSPTLRKLAHSSLYPLLYVLQQFIHWLFMAYSLVPFCLLTYDKWLRVSRREGCVKNHGTIGSVCDLIIRQTRKKPAFYK